jgi:hypothetical protein
VRAEADVLTLDRSYFASAGCVATRGPMLPSAQALTLLLDQWAASSASKGRPDQLYNRLEHDVRVQARRWNISGV